MVIGVGEARSRVEMSFETVSAVRRVERGISRIICPSWRVVSSCYDIEGRTKTSE
jgi:hypothetical protein